MKTTLMKALIENIPTPNRVVTQSLLSKELGADIAMINAMQSKKEEKTNEKAEK